MLLLLLGRKLRIIHCIDKFVPDANGWSHFSSYIYCIFNLYTHKTTELSNYQLLHIFNKQNSATSSWYYQSSTSLFLRRQNNNWLTRNKYYYPLCSKVFMLKPKVGEIVSISSPLNFFRIVVFPALSSPLVVC